MGTAAPPGAAAGPGGLRPGAPHATPVLITHGDADTVVPRAVVERSVQLMRSAAGVGEVALHPVPGKGHGMMQVRGRWRHSMPLPSSFVLVRPCLFHCCLYRLLASMCAALMHEL